MKRSELRKIIKEEIQRLNEAKFDNETDAYRHIIANFKKITGKNYDETWIAIPSSLVKKVDKWILKNVPDLDAEKIWQNFTK